MEDKKFVLKGNKVTILDPEIRRKIDNVLLSGSTINSILSSPGDWVLSKYIEPLVIQETPIFLKRGNWVHSVMEAYYSTVPKEERTQEKLAEVVKEVTKEKFPEMLDDLQSRQWFNKAIWNFINEDKGIKEWVGAKAFISGAATEGVEVRLMGKLFNSNRNMIGFIDLLAENDDGTLSIVDWKTGHFHKTNIEQPESSNNSYDYWVQQICYVMLLESMGYSIKEAKLVYLIEDNCEIEEVDISSLKLRLIAKERIEKVEKIISNCIEDNYTFELKPGIFNRWCKLLTGKGSCKPCDIFPDKLNEIMGVE